MSAPGRLLLMAAILCAPTAAIADTPPSLGAAASFVVLGASSVDNSGGTIVTGDVGVSPGNSVTGFPPGQLAVGGIFRNDATARQAHNDAVAAFNALLAQPGVRSFTSPLSGTLELEGSATDVLIFHVAGPLVVARGAEVRLSGGLVSSDVFWLVDGPVTLETRSSFAGTILAQGGITFGHVASISGRALALNGVVTSDTDNLTLCCSPLDVGPAALPNPTVNTPYTAKLSADGGTPPYTFTRFDGSLPDGLALSDDGTISGTPAASGTFTFTARVKDAHGCSDLRTYDIAVCGAGTLTPINLADATLCVPYEATVVAGVSRDLPAWLRPCGDKICGTPPATGDFSFSVTGTDASGCPFTQPYTLHVNCAIVPAPPPLPTATVGESYTAILAEPCGVRPLTFEVVDRSALPPGLDVTRGLAVISPGLPAPPLITGIPTKPGTYTFKVKFTDSSPLPCATTVTYTIDVVCGTLLFLPATLPSGDLCTIYNQTVAVTGGLQPYTFDVTGLPPGVTFAPKPPQRGTAVTLSGLPAATGTFNVKIVTTDAAGCQGTKTVPIEIRLPSALTLLPETLPPGCIGGAYNARITVGCGTPPIAFAVTAGALPDGLALCPGGVICGTPAPSAHSSTFTITANDALSVAGSRTYTIAIAPPITIDPPALPAGKVNQKYEQTLTARGGTGPFVFTPPMVTAWLALSPGGTLSGTPPTIGDFSFIVTATDTATGCFATHQYTVKIRPACDGVILTPPSMLLPYGTVSVPYSQAFVASGGTGPYRFSAPVTPLPPGLTISTTGMISGTPTLAGRFNFAIVATDATGATNCAQIYTIVIGP